MYPYYFSYNEYLRQRFGERVVRLSFDTGYPCPWGKCIFCNHDTFVPYGNVVLTSDNYREKLAQTVKFMYKRYKARLFIAYFQNNTSTYGDIEVLRKMYKLALERDDVVGLVVSTRPDYIYPEIIDVILDIDNDSFLEDYRDDL